MEKAKCKKCGKEFNRRANSQQFCTNQECIKARYKRSKLNHKKNKGRPCIAGCQRLVTGKYDACNKCRALPQYSTCKMPCKRCGKYISNKDNKNQITPKTHCAECKKIIRIESGKGYSKDYMYRLMRKDSFGKKLTNEKVDEIMEFLLSIEHIDLIVILKTLNYYEDHVGHLTGIEGHPIDQIKYMIERLYKKCQRVKNQIKQ